MTYKINDGDYAPEFRDSFHFLRHPERPGQIAFVHKSAYLRGQISIGDRSVVGIESHLTVVRRLEIGAYTELAGQFRLIQSGRHPMTYVSTYAFNKALQMNLSKPDILPGKKDVQRIGNDVWAAANVTLLEDVDIADGCVIGTGAVVTRDTEPYGVYMGVPARLVRKRVSDTHIEKLLKIKWWTWDVHRIRRNTKFFDTDLATYTGNLDNLIVD